MHLLTLAKSWVSSHTTSTAVTTLKEPTPNFSCWPSRDEMRVNLWPYRFSIPAHIRLRLSVGGPVSSSRFVNAAYLTAKGEGTQWVSTNLESSMLHEIHKLVTFVNYNSNVPSKEKVMCKNFFFLLFFLCRKIYGGWYWHILRKARFGCICLGRGRGCWSWLFHKISPQEAVLALDERPCWHV